MAEKNLLHGFKLLRKKEFPQYQATAKLYKHEKHGCQFLDFETKDSNNTFAITVRTIPFNDSGSTHVLEHMVLHGSKKYPINDVFTELNKRSIANYMNAETFLDWTQYLFSTKNETDFHNILDVYMDAVFHPELGENNFLLECHHLEPNDTEDDNSTFKHSGVVYNEMAGLLTDGEALYDEKLRAAMLPDTPYRFVNGGSPPAIAKMTLDELKEEHKKYYSPSNALFFHYGSIDIDRIFEHVNSFLENIERTDVVFPVEKLIQPKWTEPKRIECEGPMETMGDDNKQIKSTISWLVGDISNEQLYYDLFIISSLISDGCASPLYQKLIKSQIANDFLMNGVDSSAKNMTFSVGVSGLDEEGIQQFYDIVMGTLQEIVDGDIFTEERIESALNSIEINCRKVSSNIGKYIISTTTSEWVHGIDPFHSIDIMENIDALRNRIHSNPRYLQGIIKQYLLDNKSYVHFIMRPVKDYFEKQNKEVQKELDDEIAKMTKDEKQKLFEKAKELKEHLQKPKPLHLLPSIKAKDISRVPQNIDYTLKEDVYTFPAPTNGIIYIKLRCEIDVNNPLIEMVQIFSNCACALGAGDYDDEQFSIQEDLYTGGYIPSTTVDTDAESKEDEPRYYIMIETSCLERNIDKMMELFHDVVLRPMLNNREQIIALTNMLASQYNDMITCNADSFAMMHAGASLRRTNALSEITSGISFYKHLSALVEEESWDEICQTVQDCYDQLFIQGKFDCAINCEEKAIPLIEPKMRQFIKELNGDRDFSKLADKNRYAFLDEFINSSKAKQNTMFEIDSSTNCTAISRIGPLFNDDLVYAASVLSYLYSSEIFYDDVRGKLNAYGADCIYKSSNGTFTFSSFRDPNCAAVIEASENALHTIADGNINEEMVDRAIVKLFTNFDKPTSPANHGLGLFLGRYNNEERRKRRLKFLAVTPNDLVNVAKYLLEQIKSCTIVGNTSVSQPPETFNIEKLGE